ncbi:glycoside hydrolase family 113 [Fulvivirga lutimaris]|uniref:glycoside hydrolase family 113 n=1 Tax=Fulvivirga lutimaris TaxID=1819566 RepID=UPI0012BC01F8|nr:hypothetical protein [Fulvivirga lutimaris]MTI39505.1 hypothetical protein [Fulvivirga lutimaris]
MKKVFLSIILVGVMVIGLLSFNKEPIAKTKINGVSFVAPRNEISADVLMPLQKINTGWMAVIPYAFTRPEEGKVHFNHTRQHWGESIYGAAKTIEMARAMNIKSMVKPHVWVRGQGWAGDFELENEEKWDAFEDSYTDYILAYAKMADSVNAELFCIGTEFRKAVMQRPAYWEGLIKKVRQVYKGKVTYAANWDNFENVTFWNQLDYIGVDAYFPISEEKTPSRNQLIESWTENKKQLQKLSKQYDKPVLFTEFGFQSVDFTADGHWKYDQDTLAVNHQAQANAFDATFDAFWKEDWFAGGFVWKWHSNHGTIGGIECKEFTPQNKQAEGVIKEWFGKSQY